MHVVCLSNEACQSLEVAMWLGQKITEERKIYVEPIPSADEPGSEPVSLVCRICGGIMGNYGGLWGFASPTSSLQSQNSQRKRHCTIAW